MSERIGVFKQTLANIKSNKQLKDSGGYNSIPFGLPSLDRHVPGIMKGLMYLITASSGVGKSMLTRFLGVLQPYKFVKDHPELGIKLKIIYFALEESKEEFMLNLICNRLKDKYNISVGPLQLRSMGENILSDDILVKIEECGEYFEELEECLDIVDNVSNPYGIYNHVRQYSNDNGIHYYRLLKEDNKLQYEINAEEYNSLTNETKKLYCYSRYQQNDPSEFVIVISDHLSLLQPEDTPDTNTVHSAMSKFSAEYCRKMISKNFGYCIINVQQQAAETEKQQFTYSGQSIESKLVPSLNGLGDNKLTQRDHLIILGLFAPDRYEILEHMGYRIAKLKDNYRCLIILKNRLGLPSLKLPLYFNGQTNLFRELPPPTSSAMTAIYNALESARTQSTTQN